MRFLANENIPAESVRRLREAGHDVFSISEALAGAKDPEVLARAREEGRILLTFDRDYGELIYRRGLPVPLGIVYLRFVPQAPGDVADLVEQLQATLDLILEGRYTVIDSDRIRQRPLP
jgi:predicted nuclease of predicted toxin-antitoxin system